MQHTIFLPLCPNTRTDAEEVKATSQSRVSVIIEAHKNKVIAIFRLLTIPDYRSIHSLSSSSPLYPFCTPLRDIHIGARKYGTLHEWLGIVSIRGLRRRIFQTRYTGPRTEWREFWAFESDSEETASGYVVFPGC